MTTLLVASTGGHLGQLHALASRFAGIDDDRVWVTFDSPQASSLLEGERVVTIPDVLSRDYKGVAKAIPGARRLMRRHDITHVVSTGAAIALSYLPVAAALGIPAFYIESATRTHAPSTTGRILERLPGVTRFTQYQSWASERWSYCGSVLDGFEPGPRRTTGTIGKVVVTLGVQEKYGFRRLVERLLELLPPDADVLWQVGATDTTGLDIDARHSVPSKEFEKAIADADLVVAHAGTGTVLTCLNRGVAPLLVPRERDHGEHVDDHQFFTARELARRSLATWSTVDGLTSELIHGHLGKTVTGAAQLPSFDLHGSKEPLPVAM